jgi:hypothetical protein
MLIMLSDPGAIQSYIANFIMTQDLNARNLPGISPGNPYNIYIYAWNTTLRDTILSSLSTVFPKSTYGINPTYSRNVLSIGYLNIMPILYEEIKKLDMSKDCLIILTLSMPPDFVNKLAKEISSGK